MSLGGAPAFDAEASGSSAHWNAAGPLSWGNRTTAAFPAPPGAKADINTMLAFLRQRHDRDGIPVLERLEEPEEYQEGWWRLPLKQDPSLADPPEDWPRAWHGSKVEALYSTMIHGLQESRGEERGDRRLRGTDGVYLHKDENWGKVEYYAPFVQVCSDGVFWACRWEVRADRARRARVTGKTDQWIQPADSIRTMALWLCGRVAKDMVQGAPVMALWIPRLEANPFDRERTRRAAAEMRAAEARSEPRGDPPVADGEVLDPRRWNGGEGLFCKICDKWATAEHIESIGHRRRLADHLRGVITIDD